MLVFLNSLLFYRNHRLLLLLKNNDNIRWKSSYKKIDKLLIANRGEIACRVIRTAHRLGIRTVAVYSDADKNALHVEMADEAYNIGPAPATQSYLVGQKIIDVAKYSNSKAIHPGYGFLSENAEFAENCQKNSIIFIGPPASAIRDMGFKNASKTIMSSAGVSIIESYHGDNQNAEFLKAQANQIGYPIMIKAIKGGGGKGMRIAWHDDDFMEALNSARTESNKAFNDTDVLLEKFIPEPRHVEVQIFADTYGNVVYLFERDCSVQRRHQKIIEEAPAPGLSEDLRIKLGQAAIRAAKAVGYVGAGTVEFILDKNTHKFYFMEMNTRLQVEHPVTEMITGIDLVEWQISVASGAEIPMAQADITHNGHSFEARIYAENPQDGFLPGAGPLKHLSIPQSQGDDVRIETGVREGDDVSVHYDPMIAKLVVWGKDRSEALLKLQSNLTEYNIAGLDTNINFLIDLTKHPEFKLGNVHTNFIKDHHNTLFREDTPQQDLQIYQAVLYLLLLKGNTNSIQKINDPFNPFFVEANFRVNHNHVETIKLKSKGKDYSIKVEHISPNKYCVLIDNDGINNKWKTIHGKLYNYNNKLRLKCSIDNKVYYANAFSNDEILTLFTNDGKVEFNFVTPKYLLNENNSPDSDGGGGVGDGGISPMPGILDKLFIKIGDNVKKGDPLFVLIAMKMEYIVKANRDCTIQKICYNVGDSVPKGSKVVQFN